MTLQQTIKKDLTAAIKAKDEPKKSALRVILGELGRADTKELSEDQIIRILKKLLKSEMEVMQTKGETFSAFIEVIEDYLPKMATDEEIVAWIQENIDFSQFKNQMQAMGPIMKHFGATVDGNRVRALLQKM